MTRPVLLVEDETIVREALRDWLTDEGYSVNTAEDGEKALDMVRRQEYGVVVLDLRLPGKDGIQVLKEARGYHPDLKAIIITAYPSAETASEAMKAGAFDYVVKPFTPDALEKLLQQALDKKPEAAPVKAEDKTIEVGKREEVIAAAMDAGKSAMQRNAHDEAVKEFAKVIQINTGHLDARVWLQKAKRAQAGGNVLIGGMEEAGARAKPCVWMKMGVVKYRMCSRDFDCLSCEFDQQMQSAGESPEMAAALENLKDLPGPQRTCRYALRGEVSYRLCSRIFNCNRCEFSQTMEDALEQRLAKLAIRREALKKKQSKTA